jgi:hypothetical protein
MDQESQLNSYGWVDEKAGVAHIPIKRAMELLAQRGVPVYQPKSAEGKTGTPASGNETPAKSNEKSGEKGKGSEQ